jgi:hypothetical protein
MIARARVMAFIKSAWVVSVVTFISIYLVRHWPAFLEALAAASWQRIAVSATCLLAAKCFLALQAQLSLLCVGVKLEYGEVSRVYHATQLAKYIPGSVWHFVGRVGAYRERGLSAPCIRDAMIVENVFLLGGAFLYGLVMIGLTQGDLIMRVIRELDALIMVPLGLIGFGLVIAALFRKRLVPLGGRVSRQPALFSGMVATQLLIWILMGLFWAVLITPHDEASRQWVYQTGLFALAFVLGFITPIAPAGIGVRETVLVLGLSPFMPVQQAIMLSTLSRLISIGVEVALAAIILAVKPEQCTS